MAKFCSWCGEPLEPGARYCAECGARVLETVKVDGKGAADPMRGLDIVAGRPIPADKTMKLDRQTREALKLSDALPGDGEEEPSKAAQTTKMGSAAGHIDAKQIPAVMAVPEIVEVPEIGGASAAEDAPAAAEAEALQDGAIPADGQAFEGAGEIEGATEQADSEAASSGVSHQDGRAEAEGEDAFQEETSSKEPVAERADSADDGASDSEEGQAQATSEDEGAPEDEGASDDAQLQGAGGKDSADGETEAEPSDGAEPSDEADSSEGADAASGGSAEADGEAAESSNAGAATSVADTLQPSESLPGIADSIEEEDEAVPVIPREAQAAAAKPGPMSFDGTDTLVLPSDAQPKRFGLDRPDLAARKRKRALIALCCVIAALAVAACVLAYMRFGAQPAQEPPEPAPATQQAEDVATLPDESESRPVVDGPGEDGQAETLAPEQTAPTDEQIFQTLTSAYVALDGYSDRIYECVTEFNGQYMARSMDDRTAAKAKADKVKSDLEAAKAEIESLQIGQASAYVNDASNVIELYDCQIGRITSLTDAWAVSVQYDVPSQHQDEILAALGYGNGGNVYLERYDELYPSAKPVQK